MKIIKIDPDFNNAVKKMQDTVKKGKIVIYPTDTLYGIGGNALDRTVVSKIYKIKERNRNMPLSVIMRDMNIIKKYCNVGRKEENAIERYLPGPYTLLLNCKRKSLVSKTPRLGIRLPESKFIEKVMQRIEVPLITTSANISGEADPYSVDTISPKVKKAVDFIFDGGETRHKTPSTIIDVPTGKVLRRVVKKEKDI